MPARAAEPGRVYVSARMVNRRPGPQVRVNRELVGYAGGEIRLTLWRWQPRGAPAADSGAEPSAGEPQGPG